MTKLTQFIAAVAVFAAFWMFLLKIVGNDTFFRSYIILPLPFHLLVVFGIYAATTVLYRTVNFNDCPEAAKELQEQIEEARKDLRTKGFKF